MSPKTNYLPFASLYEQNPVNEAKGEIAKGKDDIVRTLYASIKNENYVTLEYYPGVHKEVIEDVASSLAEQLGAEAIDVETCAKSNEEILALIKPFLTDDRVFGLMSHFHIEDFYDLEKIEQLKRNIPAKAVFYGFGSSLVNEKNVVFAEINRWEMQLRFRAKESNWHADNHEEDPLRKFKRGYFVEWRVADRLKKKILPISKFYIDANDDKEWKMVKSEDLFSALHELSFRPFRLVPYFDPGVWGGQWMKEVCHLDPNKENFAWSFDGVPEENALCFSFGGDNLYTPASNLVFFEAKNLLGARAYGRFGDEFPIRFDFLDTMDGGNLSLQVHPLTQYIQDNFGMNYTQDESYYLLDAKEDASVYLGLKEGVKKEELVEALKESQRTGKPFDAEKCVNKFPAKKHDHFLIPAGTIHCSGKNAMVLEISATPYIFTFKLYDWGRVGLDGLPRPIHIEHGEKVIQMDRTTNWVKENLVDHFIPLDDGWVKTGLHEAEFIETRRKFFSSRIKVKTHGSVNMNNLVEGVAAKITSVDDSFAPFEVHYAETFIIPSSIEEYYIEPLKEGENAGIIQAYVR